MPKQPPITAYGSEDKILSIWDSERGGTGDWIKLPGIRGVSFDGGTREGRSVSTDSNAPTGRVGTLGATSATIGAIVSPGHRAWQLITDSLEDRTKLRFQLDLAKNDIYTANSSSSPAQTAAIASTTGAVTWAGGAPSSRFLKEGARVRIASTDYWIGEITDIDTGMIKVDPAPNSPVSAGAYVIDAPKLRFTWDGWVTKSPVVTPEIAEGGEYEGEVMVQLEAPLERPVVVN